MMYIQEQKPMTHFGYNLSNRGTKLDGFILNFGNRYVKREYILIALPLQQKSCALKIIFELSFMSSGVLN